MNESFEIEGYWWFPEHPDLKIPGILKASENEVRLHLLGALTDWQRSQEQWEYEIILGIGMDGKKITLHKCYPVNYTSGSGLPKTIYSAIQVFIGTHFQTKNDIKFKELSAKFTYFDEWVGITGFEHDIERMFISPRGYGVKYTQPNNTIFQLNENLSALIGFDFNISTTQIGEKNVTMSQNAIFSIKTDNSTDFIVLKTTLDDIRNFLSLSILQPVFTISITGSTDNEKQIVENDINYEKIYIFFNTRSFPKTEARISSVHMLFTYKDIFEKIEFYFKNWLENKTILKPMYDLYFESVYNQHLSIEQKFLILVQAIESYHRRTSSEKTLDDKSYKKLVKSMLNSVPVENRGWLSDKLRYGNELSLRKRLKILLETFPFVLDGKSKNQNDFTQYVVEKRNYFTHYDKKQEFNLDVKDLFGIIQRIELLIECCMLHELGFELSKIQTLTEKNKMVKGINKPQ